jgi:hypothetical protein
MSLGFFRNSASTPTTGTRTTVDAVTNGGEFFPPPRGRSANHQIENNTTAK